MTSQHRKDLGESDFRILALFCFALQKLEDETGASLYWLLGEIPLLLPVWYESGNGWQFSSYKCYTCQAIWIETQYFRRICKYLQLPESLLVKTLYRFSMIAVVQNQKSSDKSKFRQPTWRSSPDGWKQDAEGELGFILEARRALGGFRKKEQTHGNS